MTTRTNCFHNIAWCDMDPAGRNLVHCTLGGDVRGNATLPFDPVEIQEWIYRRTHLSCFDFDAAFERLKVEQEKKYPEIKSTYQYQAYESQVRAAREERKSWFDQKQHEESKWRCSEYSVEEEEEKTPEYAYTYTGKF